MRGHFILLRGDSQPSSAAKDKDVCEEVPGGYVATRIGDDDVAASDGGAAVYRDVQVLDVPGSWWRFMRFEIVEELRFGDEPAGGGGGSNKVIGKDGIESGEVRDFDRMKPAIFQAPDLQLVALGSFWFGRLRMDEWLEKKQENQNGAFHVRLRGCFKDMQASPARAQ